VGYFDTGLGFSLFFGRVDSRLNVYDDYKNDKELTIFTRLDGEDFYEPNTVNGLVKISSLDCFQIRSVSQDRLTEKVGKITSDEIDKVQEGILKILGM